MGLPTYRFLAEVAGARGLIALMNFLMWFGNTTIVLMAGIMGIDTGIMEAARIDGASSFQIFRKITLPIIKPIMAYTLVTSLIGGIQMFDVPQILTNGNGNPDSGNLYWGCKSRAGIFRKCGREAFPCGTRCCF